MGSPMTTKTMIERVAAALWHTGETGEDSTVFPDEVDERTRAFWREYARAAIEAMKEPTKEMQVAGDAIAHLDAAKALLCMEAYGGTSPVDMQPVDHFTIAEDLDRIDRAIGPKGESTFARIADSIRAAYVEILAARAALKEGSE